MVDLKSLFIWTKRDAKLLPILHLKSTKHGSLKTKKIRKTKKVTGILQTKKKIPKTATNLILRRAKRTENLKAEKANRAKTITKKALMILVSLQKKKNRNLIIKKERGRSRKKNLKRKNPGLDRMPIPAKNLPTIPEKRNPQTTNPLKKNKRQFSSNIWAKKKDRNLNWISAVLMSPLWEKKEIRKISRIIGGLRTRAKISTTIDIIST